MGAGAAGRSASPALGHTSAPPSVPGAAFLTGGSVWDLAPSQASVLRVALLPGGGGGGALFSLRTSGSYLDTPFTPGGRKESLVPRFCHPRSHSPGDPQPLQDQRAPSEFEVGSGSVSSLARSNRRRTKDTRVSSALGALHGAPRARASGTHIPASPERRAAAATLLLNSRANRSLNSYNNKHHPIWAWAGRRRRHARLVGGPLIVKGEVEGGRKIRVLVAVWRGTSSPACLLVCSVPPKLAAVALRPGAPRK